MGATKRMKTIRESLISKGVSNCRLVLDFDSPPKQPGEARYDLRKSEYWIDHADLLLFVFLSGVDNAGVALELAHAINTNRASDCIVAYYEAESESTSGMIKQTISRYGPEITQVRFATEEELINKVPGSITLKLETVYYKVLRRPLGEWEYSHPKE